MHTLRLLVAVFGMSAFVTPACAQDPVSVSKDDSLTPGVLWGLSITGRADSVTIENVIVNRGCKPQQRPQLPQTLKFGETRRYGFYLCDPIEVQVITDKGSPTFTWDEFTQDSVSVATNWLSRQLMLTSHADSLTIKNVVVNRGNCETRQIEELPYTLKFGQKFRLMVLCDPIEVQVTTDKGSPTFTLH